MTSIKGDGKRFIVRSYRERRGSVKFDCPDCDGWGEIDEYT
jgi:predicted RNA-binding Zn-ribbon protein involved in translation (DUF1610 family)